MNLICTFSDPLDTHYVSIYEDQLNRAWRAIRYYAKYEITDDHNYIEPTILRGKHLSPKEAIEYYKQHKWIVQTKCYINFVGTLIEL